jgi:hypothetical protein
MESEKVARVLGAIVVAAALVAAFVYWPATGRPANPVQKIEAPVAAPPPVRGPVVREVPR